MVRSADKVVFDDVSPKLHLQLIPMIVRPQMLAQAESRCVRQCETHHVKVSRALAGQAPRSLDVPSWVERICSETGVQLAKLFQEVGIVSKDPAPKFLGLPCMKAEARFPLLFTCCALYSTRSYFVSNPNTRLGFTVLACSPISPSDSSVDGDRNRNNTTSNV